MTPGQAAYAKWNELLRPTFLPVLWENLSELDKLRWELVAEAAAMRYVEIHDMHG